MTHTKLAPLMSREPTLWLYSLLMLGLTLAGFYLQTVDARTFESINIWVKPTKFALSTVVYAITFMWFFGYVRPERRKSVSMRFVVWALIVTSAFEVGYIALQASKAEASHFNTASSLGIIMYSLMGVAAVILILVCLPLAWEILRRPVSGLRNDYRFSVILGLTLSFILTLGVAGYMSSSLSHSVGEMGRPMALMGWNRDGGDLRVSHFFALHLMQALPLVSALSAPLPKILRWGILAMAVIFGIGLTIFTFVQALNGAAFLPEWLV